MEIQGDRELNGNGMGVKDPCKVIEWNIKRIFFAMNGDLMDFDAIFMGYDEVIIFTFDVSQATNTMNKYGFNNGTFHIGTCINLKGSATYSDSMAFG